MRATITVCKHTNVITDGTVAFDGESVSFGLKCTDCALSTSTGVDLTACDPLEWPTDTNDETETRRNRGLEDTA